MYRDEIEGSVFAVNVRYKLRHGALEFGRISHRGRCDLDHDHVPNPLWVVLE